MFCGFFVSCKHIFRRIYAQILSIENSAGSQIFVIDGLRVTLFCVFSHIY